MRKSPNLLLPKLTGRYRWQPTVSGAWLFIDNRRGGGGRQNVGHYTRAVLDYALGRVPQGALPQKQAQKAQQLRALLTELGVVNA